MADVTRRRFVLLAGLVVGGAVASKPVADRLSDSSTNQGAAERVGSNTAVDDPSAPGLIDRLGIRASGVDDDVVALGDAVNARSPESAVRAAALLAGGDALDDLLTRSPELPPVPVDGWLLPDLTAGVAGLIAIELGDA